MKAFVSLIVLALLGFSVYNWWQVQELKQEVARLSLKVQEQQRNVGVSDQVVGRATQMLAQARDAISQMDTATAQRYVDNAKQFLQDAGKKAGPSVKWLQDEAADLGRQLQDKVNSR